MVTYHLSPALKDFIKMTIIHMNKLLMVRPSNQVVCIVMQPGILQLKKSALIFVVTLHLIDPKAQQENFLEQKRQLISIGTFKPRGWT